MVCCVLGRMDIFLGPFNNGGSTTNTAYIYSYVSGGFVQIGEIQGNDDSFGGQVFDVNNHFGGLEGNPTPIGLTNSVSEQLVILE